MEYEVIIKKSEIQQQVNLRTHYHSEGEKYKDPDANKGEASTDDEELIEMYLQKSLGRLVAEHTERLKDITFRNDEQYISLKFNSSDDNRLSLLPLLKQTLTDYLVNEIMIEWLLVRQRAWSDPYIAMRGELHRQVKDVLAQFCNRKIRRRSTNLAGI